jgi:hypothetical protein
MDEIIFEKPIHMLHDLNDLVILFYEKIKKNDANNITKKAFFTPHSKTNKKTIKKR